MGRPRSIRLRIQLEAQRVAHKSFHQCIRSHLRSGYGLAPRLVEELTSDAIAYLSGLPGQRLPEQIRVDLPVGRENHSRKRGTRDSKPVLLTPCTFEPDLVVLKNHGVEALQNARLIRLVREAWLDDALFTHDLLGKLCNMTGQTVQGRLRKLRSLGIRLPTLGTAAEDTARDYSTVVLRALIQGEPSSEVARRFHASPAMLDAFVKTLQRVRYYTERQHNARAVAGLTREPLPLVLEYQELLETHCGEPHFELLIPSELPSTPIDPGLPDTTRFTEMLERDYGLAPTEARLLHHDLILLFGPEAASQRQDGQLLFYATKSTEPAGKPLVECELVPVTLDFFAEEDFRAETMEDLKLQKIIRYTEKAKASGAFLSHADLAYLLGISTSVIERLQAAQVKENILPFPTRGREADIGRSVTHRAEIIKLWMEIYTETEIVRRTGHSYASVENYLTAFGRFILLKQQNMPLPAIRKVLSCSMKLVEAYEELYQKYNTEDYWYRFELLRQRVLCEEDATDGASKKTTSLNLTEAPHPCTKAPSTGPCARKTLKTF